MIILPVLFENLTTRKDRSAKLTLGTQELSSEDVAGLRQLQSHFGYMALKPETFIESEAEILGSLKADPDMGGKTHSKRLQSVFYVLWKQDQGGFASFDLFYHDKMEKLISHYKAKIQEPTPIP